VKERDGREGDKERKGRLGKGVKGRKREFRPHMFSKV